MLIPTYFCDCCGHAFSQPAKSLKERCPRCGDANFELLIPEKGLEVGKSSSPVTLRDYLHKTKRATSRGSTGQSPSSRSIKKYT